LGLFGSVFAASEAVIHFPNPLSKFNLGAFLTSHKLGLFVQVGIFLARDSLVEWRGPHTKLREEATWCGVSTGKEKELLWFDLFSFQIARGGSGKERSLYY
jgi:hypothetical protein